MVVKFVKKPIKPYGDDDRSAVPEIPQNLLERHGARVLNPVNALVAGGPYPPPRSTVYRAGSMLIPNDIIRDARNTVAFNEVLNRVDLELITPRHQNQYTERLYRLPRPVSLRAIGRTTKPTQVDCWLALQELRVAALNGRLRKDFVDRISVDHLLVGSVDIGGAPWEASGIGGAPWETSDAGYARGGTTGRIPVSLAAPPPPRSHVFDRRPVVAVLDTGVGPHPWFDLPDRTAPPTGFLNVFPELQDAIREQGEEAALTTPTRILTDFWDAPVTDNPLVGNLDRDTGHGTFIAGIIRQSAPDANVLAVRVLHSDGIVYESDVLLALWSLILRVQDAQENDPERMIDVVSLSLGYFDEAGSTSSFTGLTAEAIDRLRELGVLVVAAAGNEATSRRFYPAALAERPTTPDVAPQVISVGALNPSTTRALFSNEAPWVRAWATGAGVVSTFPIDVQGSVSASMVPVDGRSALDPDDYRAGFAVWDGTSFAAPLAAAEITAAMITCSTDDPALALKTVDREVAVKRARAALTRAGG
ncbi:S8 family serine peptidase [Kibdelosporangium philippinense]|uniref:S8 family serine peptidase n=1 Tax=Kibdelosporangium philippinense TaxID=211113 RepID=A0ABS8ZHF6_9PSEU|nr:S8 family serine peptidase [Kibdelosporangium philippinense]MCE7007236.1 S8 family serine peptidase [Kibdelosporangium philippinense]